jgi:ADP-heptose:LPS heptosyltransferase
MYLKQSLKRAARRLFLWGLQGAARPTLRYNAAQPDFSHPPRKLLLIRPDHLGDVLLLTPALAVLRKALPHTEITVMVSPSGAASLENNPHIDRVVRCDFPGMNRQATTNPLSPYLYALEQSRQLRAKGYDAAINFRYDYWWGALLLFLADIPVRLGYKWPESQRFLTHQVPLASGSAGLPGIPVIPFSQSQKHSVAVNLNLVRYFLKLFGQTPALDEADTGLHYRPSSDDERYIRLQLSEWGISRNQKLVAIHPGTGATIKLWTVNGFAAVADALAAKHGVRVVFTGGAAEKGLINNILKACQTEHLHLDSSGWWGRLAALFARCDLVIGLDSGPLHLAVAAGTPSIHLFGPTDPAIFGPWGDPAQHRVILTEVDLPCQPCGVLDFQRTCHKGGYCLRTIKPAQVLSAAEELIASRDRRS